MLFKYCNTESHCVKTLYALTASKWVIFKVKFMFRTKKHLNLAHIENVSAMTVFGVRHTHARRFEVRLRTLLTDKDKVYAIVVKKL